MNSREIVMEMDVPFLPVKQLKAGNIELLYEAGRIRYMKYKGHEFLRMIYPALRDKNWVTVKPKMHQETVSIDENGFNISYALTYDDRYKATIEITGRNDELVYVMSGEALKDFESKRVGLCVHHPIPPCAGKEIIITHDGGKNDAYQFPLSISPTWPFTDVVAMKWKTANAEATLIFEGDVFETEDQRNWTDDSYKTYSGPQYKTPMLSLQKGDTMMHKITLRATESAGAPHREVPPIRHPFPKIGYSRSPQQAPLTAAEIELLRQVPFDHYFVQLDLSEEGWHNLLSHARKEAAIFDVKIELEAKMAAVEDANELIKQLSQVRDIGSLLIISEEHYDAIQTSVRQSFPNLAIGYGASGWFADLNSALPLGYLHDFLAFKVSPQVHQDDNRSILENLGSQHTLIETIREKEDGKPVHVSPLLFSHNSDDERLHTSFGAWWTINAICNFAGAGHITLFEAKGPRGIIHEQKPSPLFDLLKIIKDFQPTNIVKSEEYQVMIENENGDQIIFHKKSTYE